MAQSRKFVVGTVIVILLLAIAVLAMVEAALRHVFDRAPHDQHTGAPTGRFCSRTKSWLEPQMPAHLA